MKDDLIHLSWEEKEQLEKIRKQESIKVYNTGYNPFPAIDDRVEHISFTLSSIMFTLDLLTEKKRTREYVINDIEVLECNMDPTVLINGKREHFQRPLVWTLEQKQLLIESIYQNIDCGKILVRKYSWEELQRSKSDVLAFKDLIDGKQRLSPLEDFVNNRFPDYNGKYYEQFSPASQNKFLDHQLFGYSELPENSTDEQVLRQFLKLNVCGVPQSKEHIEFVKSLYDKIIL